MKIRNIRNVAVQVSVAGFEELRLQELFLEDASKGKSVSVAGFEELRLQACHDLA